MVTAVARAGLEGLETKVAVAEDHVRVEADRWRPAVLQTYYVVVGAIGIALLVLAHPSFDLRPITVASVALVTAFLAITERPTQSAGKAAAPMTAVVVAAAVVFGSWTLVLVLVALGAVRVRLT